MLKKFFHLYLIIIFISVLFIYFFEMFNYSSETTNPSSSKTKYYFSNSEFNWPVPGNYTITSPFGPRKSPTSGASFNHSGIDIAAIQNTNIYSVLGGIVTYTGFKGAGGYTITINTNEYDISYCHVSPQFIISTGDIIEQNSLIGFVGPKYVSNVPNNPYHDSTGKQTNGATTGCHLHLTIKKDGIAVNPLNFFN